MSQIIDQIKKLGLFPIATINDAANAAPLADAVEQGGLNSIEITFRTSAAAKAIATIGKNNPNLLIGAGTVLTVEQAARAAESGAKFIVTPGFSDKVVEYCLKHDITIMPGVATPTDIQRAIEFGLDAVKLFPAGALGGMKMLKALAAPFPKMRFVPTGGINTENLPDYLAHPAVLACGGSWLTKTDLIDSRQFDKVTQLTGQAVKAMGNRQ